MTIKKILFLCDQPTPRVTKLALALRRFGIETKVLGFFDPTHPAMRPSESGIPWETSASFSRILNVIETENPDLIHIQPFNAKEPIHRIMDAIKRPLVLDCYDFFRNCFALETGSVMDEVIGNHEIAAVQRADGLVARDLGLWKFCQINGIRRTQPTVFFPDYCLEPPILPKSRPGKPYLDIVFAGSVEIEKDFSCLREGGAIAIARALTSLGHHLHFFRHLPIADADNAVADFMQVAPNQLHFHGSVAPHEIASRLSDFDYGIHVYQGCFLGKPVRTFLNNFHEYQISARCFDYIQAALPMLSSPEFKFRYHYFRNKDFTIDLSISLLRENPNYLMERLPFIDRGALAAWGTRYHIDQHVPRLLRFYETVRARARTRA